MVSGFQDISSSEEDEMEGPQSSVEQKRNVEADVDIEITSDESEREVVTSPVVKTQDQTDSEDEQRITVLPLDKVGISLQGSYGL